MLNHLTQDLALRGAAITMLVLLGASLLATAYVTRRQARKLRKRMEEAENPTGDVTLIGAVQPSVLAVIEAGEVYTAIQAADTYSKLCAAGDELSRWKVVHKGCGAYEELLENLNELYEVQRELVGMEDKVTPVDSIRYAGEEGGRA